MKGTIRIIIRIVPCFVNSTALMLLPPIMADMSICHEDTARAGELAHKYIAVYLLSAMHHYELMGDHFKNARGYEASGDAVDTLRELGEDMAQMYVNAQAWGTSQQILDKLSRWREVVGQFDLTFGFRGVGVPFEDAEGYQRLVAQKVFPSFNTNKTLKQRVRLSSSQ